MLVHAVAAATAKCFNADGYRTLHGGSDRSRESRTRAGCGHVRWNADLPAGEGSAGMADDLETRRFAEAVAECMYARDNAARALHIRIEEVRPHYAVARMIVRSDMLNSHGVCHGAMLFAVADTAFAYASNSENKATLAVTCSISFSSAVAEGTELTAVAEMRSRGGRTGVYDVTVTDSAGEVVALFRGNSYQVRGEAAPGLDAGSRAADD